MERYLVGLSPRQGADAGILTTAPAQPLSDSQRSLKDNVAHLQDQVLTLCLRYQ